MVNPQWNYIEILSDPMQVTSNPIRISDRHAMNSDCNPIEKLLTFVRQRPEPNED